MRAYYNDKGMSGDRSKKPSDRKLLHGEQRTRNDDEHLAGPLDPSEDHEEQAEDMVEVQHNLHLYTKKSAGKVVHGVVEGVVRLDQEEREAVLVEVS